MEIVGTVPAFQCQGRGIRARTAQRNEAVGSSRCIVTGDLWGIDDLRGMKIGSFGAPYIMTSWLLRLLEQRESGSKLEFPNLRTLVIAQWVFQQCGHVTCASSASICHCSTALRNLFHKGMVTQNQWRPNLTPSTSSLDTDVRSNIPPLPNNRIFGLNSLLNTLAMASPGMEFGNMFLYDVDCPSVQQPIRELGCMGRKCP